MLKTLKRLFTVVFVALTLALGAQNEISITGNVLDETGFPMVGVPVSIEGTTVGVTTDIDGNFSLKVPSESSVLTISFMGYSSQSITVGATRNFNIAMNLDAQNLDELVVVGYGVQKKSDLTGAISSVKEDDLNKVASSNPAEALQGRVAGVSVTRVGGSPGGAVSVKIRGVGTVNNNSPLYIIDGVPGNFYYLSSDDIASMEVLKDGAAAAIYGSRAANGVILITTKKGVKGEPKVSFSAYASVTKPSNTFDMLDAEGYQKVNRTMYQNAGEDLPLYAQESYTSPNNTNWVDEIMGQGFLQNYDLRISGGGDNGTYALSGFYQDEDGSVIGSAFTKSGFKIKSEVKKGILTARGSAAYTRTKKNPYTISLRETYLQSPLVAVYDDTQKYGYGLSNLDIELPAYHNPIAVDHYNTEYENVDFISSNFSIDLDLTSNIKFQSRVGYENSNTYNYAFSPAYISNPKEPQNYPVLSETRTRWEKVITENILHYNQKFDLHSISALAGYATHEEHSEYTYAGVEGKTTEKYIDEDGNLVDRELPAGFGDPSFDTLNGGAGGTFNAAGTKDTYTRASIFGRVNYNYGGRYYLQGTVRRDGSSKFGADNRYGIFPSVALGWRLSEESFLADNDKIDNLKLRASYGVLGSEASISNYYYQSLMTTYNNYRGGYVRGNGANPWPGTISRDLQNDNLGWEETASTNIGIDFGVNRNISGSVNYFHTATTDLLIEKKVPGSAGLNNPIINIGKIVNQGVELEMTYSKTEGDFTYSVTGVLSTIANEVKELASEDQVLYGTGLKYGTDHYATQTRVGAEIGAFYLYQADGIFQTDAEAASYLNGDGERYQENAKAGDIKFKDMNNDGEITTDDKVYSGSGLPSAEYSVNFSANYKNFDVAIFFQGETGKKIYNGYGFEFEGMDAGRNFFSSTLDAWTPENSNSSIPRAVLGDPNNNNRASTRFLEDGGYLRLKTVQLGYSLSKENCKKIGFDRLRVYATGQNLLTFTKYSGLDPEIGVDTAGGVLDTGIDRSIYPQSQSIIIGVQLGF